MGIDQYKPPESMEKEQPLEDARGDDDSVVEFVRELARERGEKWIEAREHIHARPEIGETPETCEFMAQKFEALGLEVERDIAGTTAIMATLKGTDEGPTIVFKANSDAVPVEDKKDAPYRSQNPKAGHLCGHDVEMAYGLGCAEILSQVEERPGTVKFLLQPNEERMMTPLSHAAKIARSGVLEEADAIVELHPTTLLTEGEILSPEGRINAASGRYKITFHPREEDILAGKTPDANTLLALTTTAMGKYEPQPGGPENLIVRTPYTVSESEHSLGELIETKGLSDKFLSFKLALEGPGGHAAVRGTDEKKGGVSPNPNFLAAKVIAQLYEKHGNSLLTFSRNSGEPSFNSLPEKNETWLTWKGEELDSAELTQEIEAALQEAATDFEIESNLEAVDDLKTVPFPTRGSSLSTARVAQDPFLPGRREILSNLVKTVHAVADQHGLTKPPKTGQTWEKIFQSIDCPAGEWRLEAHRGTPVQLNDPGLIGIIDKAAQEMGVSECKKQALAAGSDFGYLTTLSRKGETIPGVLAILGSVTEQDKASGKVGGHHTSSFDVKKETIPQGAGILALTALEFMKRNQE